MEVSTISNEETANQIKSQMTANMPEQQKAYIQDKSIKEILSMMPDEQKNTLLEQFTSKINEMSDSIKSQAAVSSVKQIYKNVDVDTDKIQNSYIIMAGFQMLGVALVSMVSAIIIMLLSARVAAKLSKTLREKVFAKVLSFSNEELNSIMNEVKNITKEDLLKEKYTRIRQIYNDEVPYIGLFSNYYEVASNWTLKGSIPANWYNIFINIDNWYKN